MALRSLAVLALALPVATAGCAAHEPWTFALSREFYDADAFDSFSTVDSGNVCAVVAILALPLAIDLALLPIAWPHDLWVHGSLR